MAHACNPAPGRLKQDSEFKSSLASESLAIYSHTQLIPALPFYPAPCCWRHFCHLDHTERQELTLFQVRYVLTSHTCPQGPHAQRVSVYPFPHDINCACRQLGAWQRNQRRQILTPPYLSRSTRNPRSEEPTLPVSGSLAVPGPWFSLVLQNAAKHQRE